MKQIGIVDTTLRDAHQCLWATRMTTSMMLPIAEEIDRAGYEQVDLMGAIQFDVAVRYLKEDPWERVRQVRQRIQMTPLRTLIRSRNLLSFDMVPDDIIELWVERLVANGFRVVGAFDGLNDVDNMLVSLRAAKSLGVNTFGALSYSLSPVHTDELYITTARRLIEEGHVDSIMLKDAGGLLTPDRIRSLIPKLKKVIGAVPLEIHSHCMTGLAPLVYLEAVSLGADVVHTSVAPLANGPAQPSTQRFCRNLSTMSGYGTRVNSHTVERIGEYYRRVAEEQDLPVGEQAEYDSFHYQHQLPGGMISNFKFQLHQAGMSQKLDAVLEECARVREELAWPIMITPFAQLVGTQAMLNVLTGDRYSRVPDEVKKYALGYYGSLLADIPGDVLDKIVEHGSTDIALTPSTPEPAVTQLRKTYPTTSDDERLLRFMFSGNQVDEMLDANARGLNASSLSHVLEVLMQEANGAAVTYSFGEITVRLN